MRVKIAKLLAIALVITCHVSASSKADCKCIAPAPGEATHEGGNEIVTFRERRNYKLVHGVVRDANDEPLADVLVEIFDHPEWIVLDYPRSRVEQRRIAACKSGPDGSFCFDNIPTGKYELRVSKDVAWNPSHGHIVVNTRRGSRAAIKVQLSLGT
jgi:protocatechuate 3,4-dioxygenase beta subunit